MAEFDNESMLEVFTYEMTLQLQALEQSIIQGESGSGYSMDKINEIFRIMHTIKGSAAMMMFTNISVSAHAIEDLFFYLREENPTNVDYSKITDLVLSSADFIKEEVAKIEQGVPVDGDDSENIKRIKQFLAELKGEKPSAQKETPVAEAMSVSKVSGHGNVFDVVIRFDDGCEMENVRAFTVVHNMKDKVISSVSVPEDLIDESAIDVVRRDGLKLTIDTYQTYDELVEMLSGTIFLKDLYVDQRFGNGVESSAVIGGTQEDLSRGRFEESHMTSDSQISVPAQQQAVPAAGGAVVAAKKAAGQSMISVNVNKLDDLLKIMGEIVISEAMVTQNPELDGLQLDGFNKEVRQLRQLISEMQKTVMELRMVPLSQTFFKMHRIVRDMCKQLSKEIHLEIIGEETEVDKNIIEHISDPLMHIIRNSADHGIELPDIREAKGKLRQGTIILEARSSGSDVYIRVKDDGAGLDRDKILAKAKLAGLLTKAESDYTEKEIFQFIFMPGFSTNDSVTSFSGRGVGMDVVHKNLELVGGTVLVDSIPGEGSTFTMKIPLTLAIIDGMLVKMGGSKYTIPILSIKDSFKPESKDIFVDPNGNEMITVRGEAYNIVRLHEFFDVEPKFRNLVDGILIMVENGEQTICLFVDELEGQQSVVLKNLPKYIKKVRGISGCTLLGNGDISLIVEVSGFFDR